MIATQTDNKGLASMRETCRELRDGSASEFFRRYTSIEIHLTRNKPDPLVLLVDTKSPDVALAQAMTKGLILPKSSTSLYMSYEDEKMLRKRVSKRDASMFVPSSTKNEFELMQRSVLSPNTGSDAMALLFRDIAALAPQTLKLRRLVLGRLDMDGDHLTNILRTHGRHLQCIQLRGLVLTKAVECMAALAHTKAWSIYLRDLQTRDDAGNLQDLTWPCAAYSELFRYLLREPSTWTVVAYGRYGFLCLRKGGKLNW